MRFIVDTNVPIVSNGRMAAPHASPGCVITCVRTLLELQRKHVLVIDNDWHILREYQNNLQSTGQPGVGDAFLKWVLTNQANTRCCEMVTITLSPTAFGEEDYAEFPQTPGLVSFDRSDRKFVAVALAHPLHPPILNAVDSDWGIYQLGLEQVGVTVEQLCPGQANQP